jgi:hypothetical protein
MRHVSGRAPFLLAVALLAASVAACGCASGHASSDASSVAVTAAVASSSSASSAASAAAGAARRSGSSASAAGGTGGAAASFRVAQGDNSIPEFGGEAPASRRTSALAVVASFLRAGAGGDWSRACSYLAAPTRSSLEGLAKRANRRHEGCGPILAALSKLRHATADAELPAAGVSALRVRGRNAFLLYRGSRAQGYVMPMASEGGVWKLTQSAPIGYPVKSVLESPAGR